jgi:hypothetical protein
MLYNLPALQSWFWDSAILFGRFATFTIEKSLTCLEGPHPDLLWQTTRSDLLYLDLLWQQYLESQGQFLQQFHGCMRVSGVEQTWTKPS